MKSYPTKFKSFLWKIVRFQIQIFYYYALFTKYNIINKYLQNITLSTFTEITEITRNKSPKWEPCKSCKIPYRPL